VLGRKRDLGGKEESNLLGGGTGFATEGEEGRERWSILRSLVQRVEKKRWELLRNYSKKKKIPNERGKKKRQKTNPPKKVAPSD